MTATKIHLLDLAHTHTVDDSAMLVPLGVGYIKAYLAQEMGDEVEIKIFKHPEKALAAAAMDKPDIIGFANYVWNKQLNLKIGKGFLQLYVIAGCAGNIAGTTGTCAGFIQHFLNSINNLIILAHAKIIIATPNGDFLFLAVWAAPGCVWEIAFFAANIHEYPIAAFVM